MKLPPLPKFHLVMINKSLIECEKYGKPLFKFLISEDYIVIKFFTVEVRRLRIQRYVRKKPNILDHIFFEKKITFSAYDNKNDLVELTLFYVDRKGWKKALQKLKIYFQKQF
jgi:hypothetical protein